MSQIALRVYASIKVIVKDETATLKKCYHSPHSNNPGNSAIPAENQLYTCPMHPEIIRDYPENCPICEMALEPKNTLAEAVVNDE